jgi:uncharacterized membrane protein
MKSKYLKGLTDQLNDMRASKSDIDEIVEDYNQLYDDAIQTGKTDDEVWAMLGSPREVAYELLDTIKLKKERNVKTKIVAITPFLSVMIFFILGLYFDLWHPGWLVFLSIPIVSILFHTKLKDGIVGLTPFLCVITYLILGFGFDLWHPGWLVFLLIPVVAILFNSRSKDVPVAISPFVSVVVFIILGHYFQLWNPGWLVFLIIPMIGILYGDNQIKKIVYILAFLVTISFYLFMGYTYELWGYGALSFILIFLIGILYGDVHFDLTFKGQELNKILIMLTSIIVSTSLFLVFGFLLDGWIYAWQFFLMIPMTAIIAFNRFRLTPLMPFIAVILFFSLGHFFGLFQVSWLAFLLIPIVAIIENA